ncbi:MAG TPA: hypothetical protein DCZ94_00370 [Lentisphaeria bacterium]|nr:MAG: hypothetical protein A2X48_18865 [Lentisphaerae bacterium GWF2_49_21]HBC85385.1 hypothetical protein [Lentisphaeria bacterium]
MPEHVFGDELFSFASKNGNEMNVVIVNTSPDSAYKCKIDIQGSNLKPSLALIMERTEPYREVKELSSEINVPVYSLVLVKYLPAE